MTDAHEQHQLRQDLVGKLAIGDVWDFASSEFKQHQTELGWIEAEAIGRTNLGLSQSWVRYGKQPPTQPAFCIGPVTVKDGKDTVAVGRYLRMHENNSQDGQLC